MKIQFISDLHFEFPQNVDFINSSPLKAVGEVLVLAGDTGYLNDEKLPKMKFWEWTSSNFKHVLLIPGNHEFYNYADILSEGDSWCRMIKLMSAIIKTRLFVLMILILFFLHFGQIFH